MPTPEKEKLVAELTEKLSQRQMAILTDYTGINVQAVTGLRNEFRKASVEYRIFKNTLARIAADKAGLEGLAEFLDGPTGYAFSDDPVAPAKVLADFIKSNPSMRIKCGIMNGRLISVDQVRAIAALPPRDVLLAQLARQIKAPISGLVNVLAGPARNLVNVLEALRKQKEAA
jgi:large subunit ribosomal protein L10